MNCEVCEDIVPCANHYLTFGAYDGCTTDDVATRIAITNTFSLRDRTVASGKFVHACPRPLAIAP